jgi:hypothetical protein
MRLERVLSSMCMQTPCVWRRRTSIDSLPAGQKDSSGSLACQHTGPAGALQRFELLLAQQWAIAVCSTHYVPCLAGPEKGALMVRHLVGISTVCNCRCLATSAAFSAQRC